MPSVDIRFNGTRGIKLFAVMSLLCSCGGGGGSDSISQSTALQDMRAATDRLVANFSNAEYTEFGVIPTTGSAFYDGFISGQLANTEDSITDTLNATLSFEVNFEAVEMVSGSANNFLDDAGNKVSGEMTLTGGTLDRDGDPSVDATFFFNGTGDLISSGGQTISLNTAFSGDFLGDSYTGVGGDIQGQATIDGTSQSFGGLFIARQ